MSELPRSFVPDPAHESMQAEKTPNQIKLREMLREIDEEKLRRILFQFFALTGHDEAAFTYIPIKHIVLVDDPEVKTLGEYRSDTKQLTLNAHLLHSELTGLLHVFIHEELHAIRDYEDNGEEVLSEFAEEGLTELIANDIYDIYLGNDNGSSEAAEYFYSNRQENPYGQNQKAVDFYIGLLAIVGNQHKQHIRNILYKAYIKKETILPAQTLQVLNEIESGLGEKISTLLESGPTDDLIRSIGDDIQNSPELSEREIFEIRKIIRNINSEDKIEEKAAA